MIPADFIQQLLYKINIVEVIGQYVTLKKGGDNYKACCPFHHEKSPSFHVSHSKQIYKCFGCGASGNAIGFIMSLEGLNYPQAITKLAQNYGLQVPEEDNALILTDKQKQEKQAQKTITEQQLQLLKQSSLDYFEQLQKFPESIEYLKNRGISGFIAKRFLIGYAPNQWDFLLKVTSKHKNNVDDFENITNSQNIQNLITVGLVIRKTFDEENNQNQQNNQNRIESTENKENTEYSEKIYDRFRHRIMFPIRNVKGQTIGFGGRVLDQQQPKYLNSPETPYFHKGKEVYGLYESRQSIQRLGHVYVVEGYMDVVMLHQHGVENAVATLGTACTTDHLKLLWRYTDDVIFAFDGDEAGNNAAWKALQNLLPIYEQNKSIRFLFLQQGEDPDSWVRKEGKEGWERLNKLWLSEFIIQKLTNLYGVYSAEQRTRFAQAAYELLKSMPEVALKIQIMQMIEDITQMNVFSHFDNSAHNAHNAYSTSKTAYSFKGSQTNHVNQNNLGKQNIANNLNNPNKFQNKNGFTSPNFLNSHFSNKNLNQNLNQNFAKKYKNNPIIENNLTYADYRSLNQPLNRYCRLLLLFEEHSSYFMEHVSVDLRYFLNQQGICAWTFDEQFEPAALLLQKIWQHVYTFAPYQVPQHFYEALTDAEQQQLLIWKEQNVKIQTDPAKALQEWEKWWQKIMIELLQNQVKELQALYNQNPTNELRLQVQHAFEGLRFFMKG